MSSFQKYLISVKIPDETGFQDAAAVLLDGIKAYTALHYQAHLCGGDTVLVIDGATSVGSVMIQLAQSWGAKVLTTYSSVEEKGYLESLPVPVGKESNICSVVSFSAMTETASHKQWSS